MAISPHAIVWFWSVFWWVAQVQSLHVENWRAKDVNSSKRALLPIRAMNADVLNWLEHQPRRLSALRSYHLGSIAVAIVDTRLGHSDDSMQPLDVTNVGAGKPWSGLKTKTEYFIDWLESDTGSPDRMIVLVDGGDVVYGGCSEQDLLQRYHNIIAWSHGAPPITNSTHFHGLVVLGAELGAYPPSQAAKYVPFGDRQRWVISRTASPDAYSRFADCRDTRVGPCSQPLAMQYLNSGFYMGPAHAVLSMLREVKEFFNDQQGAAEAMFKHPDLYTLDYLGDMVLNLHNFKAPKQGFAEPGFVVEFVESQCEARNRVNGKVQCFVHGNGNGKGSVHRLADDLSRCMATSNAKG